MVGGVLGGVVLGRLEDPLLERREHGGQHLPRGTNRAHTL